MTLQTSSAGNAALRAIEAVERHEMSNGHAWGYAAYTVDGELTYDRGVGRIPNDLDIPDAHLAIGHTRFATRGVHTVENAHPFPIHLDGELEATLCHNGTWYGAPKHPTKSDTRLMAERLEKYVNEGETLEQAVRLLARDTGETFLVLGHDEAYVNSGRFGITRADKPLRVASSGYAEIPDGQIIRVAPK